MGKSNVRLQQNLFRDKAFKGKTKRNRAYSRRKNKRIKPEKIKARNHPNLNPKPPKPLQFKSRA